MQPRIKVTRLPKLNTLVIKQTGGKFFIAAPDSFIIDISGLAMLLKYLVLGGFVSHKVLEGIIEEYYAYGGDYENPKNSVHSNSG